MGFLLDQMLLKQIDDHFLGNRLPNVNDHFINFFWVFNKVSQILAGIKAIRRSECTSAEEVKAF